MSLGRTFALSTGLKIPAVGLGTWQSAPGEVAAAVQAAIKVGYRHIDAAWIYRNEPEVAQGIRDSGIDRKELFITSKLWNSSHAPERVEKACKETLNNLGVSYLDLYLMHWPVAFGQGKAPSGGPVIDQALTADVMPTWRAMEDLVDKGLVKHIGVSNFTAQRVQAVLDQASIKPAVNQVELNLRCAQPELVEWSKKNGVLLEAYSPLGSTGAPQLEDPVVQELAKKHKVGPANILISWQVARGIVVLPKSVTPSRIESNFQDVELTDAEVDQLNRRAAELGQQRTVDPSQAWGVDIFGAQGKSTGGKL